MGRFSKLELGEGRPAPEEREREEPASPLARPEEDYDAPTHLRRGLEHFFDREYEEALRRFGEAIKHDSRLLDAWAGQIDALIEMGQLREANVWTTRALDHFPDDPTLLSLRAVLLARQGMAKRAIGTSDYALNRGHTIRGWIARGEILLTAGNANANFCLDKALEEVPDSDWQTLMRVGHVWRRHRKHAKAIGAFQRAAGAEPGNAQIWVEIAECQDRLGFADRALEAAKRAHELRPDSRAIEDLVRRSARANPLRRLWRRLWRR